MSDPSDAPHADAGAPPPDPPVDLALVTGASSDLGLALVQRLAGRGTRVLAHHHAGAERLRALADASDPPLPIQPLQADLRDAADVTRLIDAVAAIGCPTQIVHLPALPLRLERFTQVDWGRLDDDLHVQVRALGMILQRFLPAMVKDKVRGRVVVMLSSATLSPPPKAMASYVIAKTALYGLVRAVAAEYADRGIAVNAVSPYTIETRFLAETPSKYVEVAAAANPMKRNASVDDAVAAVEFLLSSGAAFLSGVNLPVTGGGAFA